MSWTGTLRDDIAALGGLPAEREEELFFGMFVLGLALEEAMAYIRAEVPIVTYVRACDRSWTVEQVVAAWEAGIPADYVHALGSVPEGAS